MENCGKKMQICNKILSNRIMLDTLTQTEKGKLLELFIIKYVMKRFEIWKKARLCKEIVGSEWENKKLPHKKKQWDNINLYHEKIRCVDLENREKL